MLFLKVYNFWRKRKGTLETSNTDKHHISPCLCSFIFSDYYSWPNTTHLSLPIHSYPRPLQSLHCISLIPTVWNYTKCSTCVLPIWYVMFTYFLFPLISVIFQVDWITSSLPFPTPYCEELLPCSEITQCYHVCPPWKTFGGSGRGGPGLVSR